jgi:hypothetical protein
MQTFLPYPDYVASARCLDRLRLNKQRSECWQIATALTVSGAPYTRHPAVLMWEGHVGSLCMYMEAVIDEWRRRGYRNTIQIPWMLDTGRSPPPWLGDAMFHASHRSNLLRKDARHYGRFGWKERADLEYVWPKSTGQSTMKKETDGMTSKLIALPKDLLKTDLAGLQNLHSDMLATASDVAFEPPPEFLVELETPEQARVIVEGLHAALQKHLAADDKKKDTKSSKKTETTEQKTARLKAARLEKEATDKATQKPADKPTGKQQKEKTVAKKAKKAVAKKKASNNARAGVDTSKKITWLGAGGDAKDLGAREGSERHERRKKLKAASGKTIESYVKGGGSIATLNRAVSEKIVKVA